MISALNVADQKFEHYKDYAICFCCFSTQHAAEYKSKNKNWLGMRQIFLSRTTCLPVADCCFNDLTLCKSN